MLYNLVYYKDLLNWAITLLLLWYKALCEKVDMWLTVLTLRYFMRQRVRRSPEPPMHLAVVACGDRLEETVTMIKSAVLFNTKPLCLHIFAEDQLRASFVETVSKLLVGVCEWLAPTWPLTLCSRWSRGLALSDPSSTTRSTPSASPATTQPSGRNSSSRVLHRGSFYRYASKRKTRRDIIMTSQSKQPSPACVFFRFTQLILKHVDSILYVDSDILFLQPVDHLWAFLSEFNSSQLAAMAPEHEEPRIAWYNRFARHPFYGKTGVNSGVMLMNMTRMRAALFKVGLRQTCTTVTGHKVSSLHCR